MDSRFYPMSDYMKLRLPTYYASTTAEEHLMKLDIDLYQLKRIYERNSPIMTIQRYYKGYKERKLISKITDVRYQAAQRIQKIFRGWYFRLKCKRDLELFALTNGLGSLLLS